MKSETDLTPAPAGVTSSRSFRRNQTQLILPTGAADFDRFQGVIVDWLVPALVEKFLLSIAANELNEGNRTIEALSRGEVATEADI